MKKSIIGFLLLGFMFHSCEVFAQVQAEAAKIAKIRERQNLIIRQMDDKIKEMEFEHPEFVIRNRDVFEQIKETKRYLSQSEEHLAAGNVKASFENQTQFFSEMASILVQPINFMEKEEDTKTPPLGTFLDKAGAQVHFPKEKKMTVGKKPFYESQKFEKQPVITHTARDDENEEADENSYLEAMTEKSKKQFESKLKSDLERHSPSGTGKPEGSKSSGSDDILDKKEADGSKRGQGAQDQSGMEVKKGMGSKDGEGSSGSQKNPQQPPLELSSESKLTAGNESGSGQSQAGSGGAGSASGAGAGSGESKSGSGEIKLGSGLAAKPVLATSLGSSSGSLGKSSSGVSPSANGETKSGSGLVKSGDGLMPVGSKSASGAGAGAGAGSGAGNSGGASAAAASGGEVKSGSGDMKLANGSGRSGSGLSDGAGIASGLSGAASGKNAGSSDTKTAEGAGKSDSGSGAASGSGGVLGNQSGAGEGKVLSGSGVSSGTSGVGNLDQKSGLSSILQSGESGVGYINNPTFNEPPSQDESLVNLPENVQPIPDETEMEQETKDLKEETTPIKEWLLQEKLLIKEIRRFKPVRQLTQTNPPWEFYILKQKQYIIQLKQIRRRIEFYGKKDEYLIELQKYSEFANRLLDLLNAGEFTDYEAAAKAYDDLLKELELLITGLEAEHGQSLEYRLSAQEEVPSNYDNAIAKYFELVSES